MFNRSSDEILSLYQQYGDVGVNREEFITLVEFLTQQPHNSFSVTVFSDDIIRVKRT